MKPDVNNRLILEADRLVKQYAVYVADPALRDNWKSFANDVEKGIGFRGDCDDWSMTTLEILFRWGVPRTQLYRALVSSTGAAIDHMIGIVELDNGERWSVGDTFGPPRRVRDNMAGPHKILQTSRMDERRGGLPLWRLWGKAPMARETNTASMGLSISEQALGFLKAHEKFMSRAYDDFRPNHPLKAGDKVLGTLTIGYGHTGPDVKIGQIISLNEADRLLLKDLSRFEAAVRRLVRVPLQQWQYDALVSFAFNCGEGNLTSSTLLKKVNAVAPQHEIQTQFRRWTRSKGKVLNGLVRRREDEAQMWAGVYPVATHAVATPAEADVSPTPLVEEVKNAGKSVTLWLTGLVTVAPLVVEAAREARNMGVEIEMGWLTQGAGWLMALGTGLVFAKRIYEIKRSARR